MQKKHTPGPWLAEQELRQDGTPIPYRYAITAETTPSPGFEGEAFIMVAETASPANAQLIAASPEMVDALLELIQFAQQCCPEDERLRELRITVIQQGVKAYNKATDPHAS